MHAKFVTILIKSENYIYSVTLGANFSHVFQACFLWSVIKRVK